MNTALCYVVGVLGILGIGLAIHWLGKLVQYLMLRFGKDNAIPPGPDMPVFLLGLFAVFVMMITAVVGGLIVAAIPGIGCTLINLFRRF